MSEVDRERREMAKILRPKGESADRSLEITRRVFIHKSLYTGAVIGAAGAALTGWFPMMNTMTLAYASEPPFSFAWISDTHLYPKSVNTRFVDKVTRAATEVQAMHPPADFLIFGGDIAQLGRVNELDLGNQILQEVKIKKYFIPGEHDWYFDMGEKWKSLYGAPNWTFDHKGVRFIGLDTISRAPRLLDAAPYDPGRTHGPHGNAGRHGCRALGRRRQRPDRVAAENAVGLAQGCPGGDLQP